MDFVLFTGLVFGVFYLSVQQANLAASQRFARTVAARGRSTMTATKWGYVLSMNSYR